MPNRVVPFYVVCDTSYSMVDHLDNLNSRLRELTHETRSASPELGEARVCLIGFADRAEIIHPLDSHDSDLPEVRCTTTDAETRYAAVFDELRRLIPRDLSALELTGHQVARPLVFFLSDGQPTDHPVWPAAHRRLVEPTWTDRPTIVAFGIGDADTATIAQVGTHRAFMSGSDTTPASAIREFSRTLTRSLTRARTDIITTPNAVPCLPDRSIFSTVAM